MARKPRTIVTPEQYDAINRALPSDTALAGRNSNRVRTALGELTELRGSDLNPVSRMLTVSRAVTEVASTQSATGLRFAVKNYPKDREYRRVKLSPEWDVIKLQGGSAWRPGRRYRRFLFSC